MLRRLGYILLAAVMASVVFFQLERRDARELDVMLEQVELDHFQYFLHHRDQNTGLIYENSSERLPASIANVGFALSIYPLAVERQWISRDEAVNWTLKVLTTLWQSPQGPSADGVNGYHGLFYHYLDPTTGLRARGPKYWSSEISPMDNALLIAGVQFASRYYEGDDPRERSIRQLAEKITDRAEWDWIASQDKTVFNSWSPESGFSQFTYNSYSEALLLYVIAMGSPTHPLPEGAWAAAVSGSKPDTFYGQTFVHNWNGAGPLFTYQFPHAWIDFRGICDAKNREVGFDYFENSRRATIAQYRYALENLGKWLLYGKHAWGLTASNGPGPDTGVVNGIERKFFPYIERSPVVLDDGTIAPSAALGSMPFAPELVIPLLRYWLKNVPEIYGPDGFTDAFNPSFDTRSQAGWVSPVTIGEDQAVIVMMIENYRTGFFWKSTSQSSYLRRGLLAAGFTGGWLLDRP